MLIRRFAQLACIRTPVVSAEYCYQRPIQGGGFVGFGRTPLRPGVVVENARTACMEADPFPFCVF